VVLFSISFGTNFSSRLLYPNPETKTRPDTRHNTHLVQVPLKVLYGPRVRVGMNFFIRQVHILQPIPPGRTFLVLGLHCV
jgi:hypothetical protein